MTVGDDGNGSLATAGADKAALTVGEVLDLSARKWGQRIAVVDGEDRCTYSQLRLRALEVASGLAGLGIRKGDRVAVCLPNGLDWVAAFFGALYAGAVVVPLNTALSAREMEYQVGQSGASVMVVCAAYRNRDYVAAARRVRDAVGHRLQIVVVGEHGGAADAVSWAELTEAALDDVELPSVDVADPALMLYTSGTTGEPKGAVHTHRFTSTLFDGIDRLQLRETDCLVLYLPLFHVYALVAGLIMMMLAGARIVLMARFDAAGSLRLIEQERATVMYGIPTTYLDQLNDAAIDQADLGSVRFALTPVTYDLCQKVRDQIGTVCLNPYGMTETAALVMVARLDDPPEIAMRTVGRPLEGMEVKVVDETTGLPLPSGRPGALMMRGPSILLEYHGKPEATAAALAPDGWFSTGDIASMDEAGNVTFIGRHGENYRVGGELVDPVEVESAIQSHPAVLRAAALGVPDERLGEVGYAWVQVRPGSGVTEAELLAHVAGVLAPFKVPRQFRIAGGLPVTPSGKVQKFLLRETLTPGGE